MKKYILLVRYNPFACGAFLLGLLLAGITFRFSVPLGVAETVCVLLLGFFSFRFYWATLERKKEQVRILNQFMTPGNEEADSLSAFPLPVVLADESGTVVWYNTLFEALLSDFSKLKYGDINSVMPFTTRIVNENRSEPLEITGDRKSFTVYPARLSGGLFALYFIDDTALKDIRTKYNLTRPVIMLMNVDSLEQAEDLLPHEDYYALNADLDRLITKWLVDNNCVFRKFTDGRFLAFTEYSNLQNMIARRFQIVDKVRESHFGPDEADITLSIGVGHSQNFRECEESAREALDMARGRGGDQVAVKNGESYEFFGGISSGKEMRGKVKSRAFAAALDEYIDNSANVLIMGHSFSDFDSIGAAAGIVAITRAKGKNAHVVVDKKRTMASPLIDMLCNGAGAISFVSPERAQELVCPTTLLVVVDTMRQKLVESPKLLTLGMRTVVIDHHRMAVDHIEGNTFEFLEPHASSACEMVTELVQYSPSKPKLSAIQAQALLSGIMLDTKDFTLRVGVKTFDAASYLRGCKADTVAVRRLFAGSAEDNILVNNIVNEAMYYDRYAIAIADIKGPNLRLVCSKAADELLSIENVDASFVISRTEDVVNISARSLGRMNVQLIMEKLGGGGHHSMAAAQIKDASVQEAKQTLQQAIEAFLKESQ